MMTDEEKAINELTGMITGDYQEEENVAEDNAEPQEEAPMEKPAPTEKEPDIKVDVAKIIAEQNKLMSEQSKKIADLESKMQSKEPEQVDEEQMMIAEAQQKLGIQQDKQKELYAMLEKQKQMEAFNQQVNTFKKEFPNIDMKEMGEWAEENNLAGMLNSGDINQWKVVANAMQSIAKVKSKPDAITPTAQKGADQSVWERVDKGEQVDQIDLGIDLLKGVGGWN